MDKVKSGEEIVISMADGATFKLTDRTTAMLFLQVSFDWKPGRKRVHASRKSRDDMHANAAVSQA